MTKDENRKPVLVIPLIVAAVVAALGAIAFYYFWLDRSQTPLLVGAIGAAIAFEKMLRNSQLYDRWKLK